MQKKEFLILSPAELSGTAKNIDKQLRESLVSDGQAFPVTVYGEEPPFMVIDGHKRLVVLKELSATIECFRLTDCTAQTTAKEEIRMNALRGLTMLEKSVLLKGLRKNGISEEQIVNEFLKKLKLPQEKRVLENILLIAELPEEEKSFFCARNFGEYLLALVFNLPAEERSLFLRFAGKFGLNHNQGRDVLEKLQQVRQKKTLEEVLKPWIERLQEEPEKAGLFFKRFILELDILCNEGSETWQKLKELKKNLPKNSVLDEKEYLKNGVVVLTTRMRNQKDAENLSSAISSLKNNF